jgi:DnaJ-class molecular chaperone
VTEIPHIKFKREGNDLITEHSISIPQAVLGTKQNIETLEGYLTLDINPGCDSGKVFSFPGKGTPIIHGGVQTNSRGTLYVKMNVKIPKSLSEEERRIYQQLEKMN